MSEQETQTEVKPLELADDIFGWGDGTDWDCTCGHVNSHADDTCQKCGN